MPTIDIKEIAKRGYKGDEDAPKELMELAEEAHKSGNFEFASDCYRQAALVFKLNRYQVGLVRDDLESQLKWSKSKVDLYQDYCAKKDFPIQEYNHSFSSEEEVFSLVEVFIDRFFEKYSIPFQCFEEALRSQGVVFSAPGNSSFRYFARSMCVALGCSDFDNHSAPNPRDLRIAIALDAIIPDFLVWAEK